MVLGVPPVILCVLIEVFLPPTLQTNPPTMLGDGEGNVGGVGPSEV